MHRTKFFEEEEEKEETQKKYSNQEYFNTRLSCFLGLPQVTVGDKLGTMLDGFKPYSTLAFNRDSAFIQTMMDPFANKQKYLRLTDFKNITVSVKSWNNETQEIMMLVTFVTKNEPDKTGYKSIIIHGGRELGWNVLVALEDFFSVYNK